MKAIAIRRSALWDPQHGSAASREPIRVIAIAPSLAPSAGLIKRIFDDVGEGGAGARHPRCAPTLIYRLERITDCLEKNCSPTCVPSRRWVRQWPPRNPPLAGK